ncbi:MAG: DUF6152 family protein [Gammaproteobacteria bacterium]|jgi:hypothetical protein|nr:DUF6152 family protein [Gammaproteobacteria bacterium]
MRSFILIISVLSSFLWSITALSHHSFSLEFDVSRPVELSGTIQNIEWTNPHAWVFIETEDDQGNVQTWAVEFLGVITLIRRGMSPDTLGTGDLVTITGFGSRDGSNTANASSLTKVETGEVLWSSSGGNN